MVLGTIYFGGYLLTNGSITAGELMSFLVAVQMLQRSFSQVSLLFGTYIKGKHAGARVFEVCRFFVDIQGWSEKYLVSFPNGLTTAREIHYYVVRS